MQDIHPINDPVVVVGGARPLSDRRVRPHNHHHQPLKCPRCDSSNTKFCYYNNYNLSQPRYFCKHCRRYWTFGGVLRNVPVGGGCRKSKRSSKPPRKTAAAPSTTAASSEVKGSVGGGGDANMLFSSELMSILNNDHDNQLYDGVDSGSATETTSFGEFLQCESTEVVGVLDPTVMVDDLLQNRGDETLDWEDPTAEKGHQGLFDFTSSIDDQAYWSQLTSSVVQDEIHWSHNTNDFPLFLP